MDTIGKVKTQAWMLMLVVFLLGGVTGASVDRFWFLKGQNASPPKRGSERGPGRMVERLKTDLNLTDEQAAAVRVIFEDMRKEFPPSLINECPGVKESREKSRARIRAILTPEQQGKYEAMNTKRDAEMREREKNEAAK
ncbi:MAG: Spy/CpxP family protein refolding chaperone [Acidobacteria bacterium]|nr:Spy/CpxP family protein refolding chaperone [Acidobacteriota bacterium]